jgi:DNA-binding NarL/FixJ family response regulator
MAAALLTESTRLIMADRKSILLIEDHDIVRRYYAERLRQLLCDDVIVEATTGQTGLDLFQWQTIDCIVLDLSLPDMSGFEVLAKLIPIAGQPRVPVVVLTAIDNGPLLQAAESKGAYVALQKELTSADELVTHVRKAMTAIPVKRPSTTSPTSLSPSTR